MQDSCLVASALLQAGFLAAALLHNHAGRQLYGRADFPCGPSLTDLLLDVEGGQTTGHSLKMRNRIRIEGYISVYK